MDTEFVTPPEIIEAQEQAIAASKKEDKEEVEAKEVSLMNSPEIPEDAKPSEEEILEFWNLMLQKKPFQQSYDLKGLKFTLQSRSSKEVKLLMAYVDNLDDAQFMSSPIARANATLAFAVATLMGADFRALSLKERLEALEENPAPLNKILIDTLSKFDLKVAIMMEEITSENF